MSHIPHVVSTAATDDFVAWPMVDTLYDYTKILSDTDPIATVPKALWGTPVAIVGAGAAGIAAAYELLRAGLKPVVYEATDRIGGRNYSKVFSGTEYANPVIAEMGAMRVPVSCKAFYHYADLLDLKYSDFPDPGKVPTTLYYDNEIFEWPAHAPHPPGPFKDIQTQFQQFMGSILNPVFVPWRKNDMGGVQKEWQKVINKYANVSYIHAITEGIPEWGPKQRKAFGALGMGSGGFGPLFPVGFLEMIRVLVNQWETDQKLIQFGINELTEGMCQRKVTLPDGSVSSLADSGAINLSTPVTGVLSSGEDVEIQFTDSNGCHTVRYPAAIVATTSHAMEFMGLTIPDKHGGNTLFDKDVSSAIRNLPMVNSSKLFIRTKTKFWRGDSSMPQNIQTDEMPRGIYCLDYPQTDNGVVLMSYTWRDDSTRLTASPPEARFKVFRNIIEKINPQFAAQLIPEDDEIIVIDWQSMEYYYGAFKLDQPGQETFVQNAYYQFLDVLNPQADQGVYLAGDSVSFAGGWTEGALQTGLNAASAACQRIGASLPADSALSQERTLYNYIGS